MRTTLIDM